MKLKTIISILLVAAMSALGAVPAAGQGERQHMGQPCRSRVILQGEATVASRSEDKEGGKLASIPQGKQTILDPCGGMGADGAKARP